MAQLFAQLLVLTLVASCAGLILRQKYEPYGHAEVTTDTNYKTGFNSVECVLDEMRTRGDAYGKNKHSYETTSNVSIIFYDQKVDETKRQEMTPDVCYQFCRTIEHSHFFGLHNGRNCYCTPFYKAAAGDSSKCDSPCNGDSTKLCGGKSKSSIFSMHFCDDHQQKLEAAAASMLEALDKCHSYLAFLQDLDMLMTSDSKRAREYGGQKGDTVTADNMMKVSNYATHLKDESDKFNKVCNELNSNLEAMGSVTGTDATPIQLAKAEKAAAEGKALAKINEDNTKPWAEVYEIRRNPSMEASKTASEVVKNYYPVTYWIEGERTWDIVNASEKRVVNSACAGEPAADPLDVLEVQYCAYWCSKNTECVAYQISSRYVCLQFKKVTEVSYYTGPVEGDECLDHFDNLACMVRFADGKDMGRRLASKDANADHIKSNELKRCLNIPKHAA